MYDISQADLNADFLRYVEERFPQWLEYARFISKDEDGLDYIKLTIPNPAETSHQQPLEITTWDEEITVFFGDFHTHFPWPDGFDGSDNRDRVMDFVQALVDEDIVIASVWTKGRLKLSSTARPTDLARLAGVPTGDHELRIASWRGTFDLCFPVDWRAYLKASHP
ncbi:hypothetical protein MHY87_07485 [Microvirga sp. ACRRW]|uniref:hypothetical protein n=1 Tax=Microvirga sp. ACRRW TaxID=2918205 RepID=UPI001EF4FF13|nr:hypothetical protein [Microvirga sp. ACRRW]MCG7392743.1 hypothetical protein [Microvirga sp. ACRRW]